MSQNSKRKEEHLALAAKFFNQEKINDFDQLHLVRPALPETYVDLNSIQTKMFNKKVSAPFFINAMTGGSRKSKIINEALGTIANQENIAMALGSANILTKEPELIDSFYVARRTNPNGVIIVNVNPDTPIKTVDYIISELNADALQIHVNSVQELAMPEGDRDFRWLNKLIQIREHVSIPVIIKEVGFGFDIASLNLLKKHQFNLVDLGGCGGTNFAQIENDRRKTQLSYLDEIGLSTVQSEILAQKVMIPFIASGGIRNPLDILKALTLGAKYTGIANTFLQTVNTSGIEGLHELIHSWKYELASLVALFGAKDLSQVTKIKYYLDLQLKNSVDQLLK